MARIRRVCLFGGPGCGKSTMSSWLFARLKMAGYEAEHVSEFVKAWTFVGRAPTSYDQVYITAKQLHKEDLVLRSNQRAIVVTESPLFLTTCYARKYGAPAAHQLAGIAMEFEGTYPAINVFIDRSNMPYNPNARFQDEQQAVEMDKFIAACMDTHGMNYSTLRYDELDRLEAMAIDGLGELIS
jgi:predicted ATPase